MINWFEEWFDSPLYDQLYADRNEEEARKLIELLEATLEINTCSKILDLGCGRGRHSINLAQKGYQVKGIDLSQKAIETARQKAKDLGLKNVEFDVSDMRLPLPQKFDAIVNLFTTFGYFISDQENKKVLDSIVQMLKQNGVFVLDYLNSEYVKSHFVPMEEGTFKDGIDFSIRRYISEGAIRKDIKFFGEELNGRRSYTEYVKLYDLEWFEKEFAKRGLHIDYTYGDYSGSEFDPQSSRRLLIISHLE